MSNLNKNIEGMDIPPDVQRVIEDAKTDGSIASIRDVIKGESLSLVEKTNDAFKEFFRVLDNEQTKLSHLEEKRKRLQEEIQLLKADIEKEQECCRLGLEAVNSTAEDLKASNLDTSSETTNVDDVGSNNSFKLNQYDRKSIVDIAGDIKKGLQGIAKRQNDKFTKN